MNVGSLFSGIGGFDLGLQRAGFRTVWFAEAQPFRRDVLRHRWPGVPVLEDVKDVGPESERVDLLCGGFPCQDLSVAGKRQGLAGERSGLFYEFMRIASELQPEWVLIENVPGLLSSQAGGDFRIVLDTLADIGFHDRAWRILDSRFFGVAQRRRRVYILARNSRGGTRASAVLLEPESGGGNPEAGEQSQSEDPLVSLSGLGSGGPDDNDAQAGRIIPAVSATLLSRQGEHGVAPDDTLLPAFCWVENQRSEVRIMGDGTYTGALPAQPGQKQAPMLAVHLTQDPISNSEFTPALSKGNQQGCATIGVSNGTAVRRLTPVECERLQGFPDGWTCLCPPEKGCSSLNPVCPLGKRYAALGDAVTVPVAEWIGRRLLTYG